MGSQNKSKLKAMLRAFKKQQGKCWLCGLPMNLSKDTNDKNRATADHVLPNSKGGAIQGNIKAAHAHCNVARGNVHSAEFIKENHLDYRNE